MLQHDRKIPVRDVMATQNYFASLTYNCDIMLKQKDASDQIDFSDSQISTSQTNCYSLSYISHARMSKKLKLDIEDT